MTDPADVLAAALAWHDAGACVLPTKTDGSKAPAVTSWTGYQTERPTRDQITKWFTGGHPGVGVVTGTVSGNLEMLELEGRAVAEGALTDLTALITETGLADLWVRISTLGYAEKTPSGGLHFLYRLDSDVPGNTKLAQRPAHPDEHTPDEQAVLTNKPDKVFVRDLAETRGEGGYVVVAPSHGTVHPSGQPWTVTFGRPGAVPTITADEREQLHRIFRSLDQTPAAEPAVERPALQVVRTDGSVSPGDDYEQRTTWTDILEPHGWKVLYQRGDRTYWRRPGKDGPGISATTGGAADGRDRLYVFSSSTEFPTEHPITKFGAVTILDHHGDHKAAAKALKEAGYGKPAPLSPDTGSSAQAAAIADLIGTSGGRLSAVDGTAARVLAEPAPAPDRFGPTQDGLARALVAHHGLELRYCPQRGKWLRWTGHRWLWDDAEQHRELIRALARKLPDDDGWRRFKTGALTANGVSGVERLARSDATTVVNFDDLDRDPWDLNTPGGTVDLRTGRISPPDPAKLHTRSADATPNGDVDPNVWRQFLKLTFDGDDELIAYLQRLVGYSATGTVGAHVLPFCFGSGGNGKGVFLEATTAVLGDYATTAPNGFLMAQNFAGHETEIARLAGARMVVCSEVNDDNRFDEAKVKQLTGGDTLTARFMRQDHFTFTPTHQLWLMGNYQPQVRAGGESFWRRLRLIPFTRRVPENQRIENFQQVLAGEHGPAILNWIIEGAVAYRARGLSEPASVKAATANYAADEDHFGRFFDECCHLGGGDNVRLETKKLRSAYEAWCRDEGAQPIDSRSFGRELKRRYGIERKPSNGRYFYVGIALLVTDEDEDRWGQ